MTQISTKGVPYIGVTDFLSHTQVLQAVAYIPDHVNRRLHVGVMMSYKTLHGIKTETGWETIWPRGEALRAIFQPHPKVFNVLHYADYEQPSKTTAEDLDRACVEAGQYLQGLQLDMVWPSIEVMRELREERPDLEIILQIGKRALALMGETHEFLDERLTPYLPYVDYFLLDESGGKGTTMEVPRIVKQIKDALLVVRPERLAVAGGLGPANVEILKNIFEISPLISCDAQGQMRSTGKATDPIEIDRVCKYLGGVCSLL